MPNLERLLFGRASVNNASSKEASGRWFYPHGPFRRLSFGELLVANSLASGSGKSFNEIMRIKAKTQGWSELAKQLNINIDSVTARLRTAGESLKYADSRRSKRREEDIRRQLDQIQNNGKITPEMMPAPVSPLAPHHP